MLHLGFPYEDLLPETPDDGLVVFCLHIDGLLALNRLIVTIHDIHPAITLLTLLTALFREAASIASDTLAFSARRSVIRVPSGLQFSKMLSYTLGDPDVEDA
jgi:hypothetical protein